MTVGRTVLCLIILLLAVPVSAQTILKPPPDSSWACRLWNICRPPLRVVPTDPGVYAIPRSVGAWSQFNDMTEAPMPWWSITTGRPFWETLRLFRDEHNLTAIGFGLRAHPTDNTQNWENIRKALRTDGIDVIVLWMKHWISTEPHCDGGETVVWQNLPLDIFDQLYTYYSQQDKTIIVMTFESDSRLHGKGCMERNKCVPWGWYWEECPAICEQQIEYDPSWPVGYGWWFPDDYIQPEDCRSICCDMSKSVRRDYMVRQYSALQQAAEDARAAHPDARLKVFFAVEVDRYGRQDEWMTTGRDVIPYMSMKPDFVGMSCWPAKCGETENEVIESFNKVMEWTSLPSYRLFLAEVGARENYPGAQYDRIMTVVPTLFDLGSPLALVWSLEQSTPEQQTTHSLIDPQTGNYRSGFQAIHELNEIYSHE